MANNTIRKIITKGFREAGIYAAGDDIDADQFEEALDLLQGLYSSFFGNELGDPLEDVNYGTQGLTNAYAVEEDQSSFIDSVYVPQNIRLVFNLPAAETVYLDPNPRDGARFAVIDNAQNFATNNLTVNGNGRQIDGGSSSVLNTNGQTREWFYRADLGEWTKIVDLDENDISPLPREFDDLLSGALAIRINPRYGAQTAGETGDSLKRMKRLFRSRYKQVTEVRSEDGIIRIPSNRYWRFRNSNTEFNRGRLA